MYYAVEPEVLSKGEYIAENGIYIVTVREFVK